MRGRGVEKSRHGRRCCHCAEILAKPLQAEPNAALDCPERRSRLLGNLAMGQFREVRQFDRGALGWRQRCHPLLLLLTTGAGFPTPEVAIAAITENLTQVDAKPDLVRF